MSRISFEFFLEIFELIFCLIVSYIFCLIGIKYIHESQDYPDILQ